MKNWFNNDPEKQKDDRRDAAQQFLEETIKDPDLRNNIIAHPENVRAYFRTHGDIDVPNDVTVICVEPETQKRDKVVVFLLPEPTMDPSTVDPMKYWLAAWIPY